MAEIGVNQDFLFLPLESNSFVYSLLPLEYDCFVYSLSNKKLKIKKKLNLNLICKN
jgi:hypothetical protein